MIALKKNKTVILKNKLINLFMQNGSKQICEKNLLKSSKILQKSSKKRFQSLLQLSIINTALTFKFNEKIIKKGKRRSVKTSAFFIISDFVRITEALKSLKMQKHKNTNIIIAFGKKVLISSYFKNQLTEQKTKLQTQILVNKRYLSKFKW
jgi:hypothetical protein